MCVSKSETTQPLLQCCKICKNKKNKNNNAVFP